MTKLTYEVSPTFTKFHNDDTFIRVVMGSVGSGKTTGCCWEAYMRALKQAPSPDGIRRTRGVVVRNTLPELETTTIATWKQWFGEEVFDGAKITGRTPYKQTIEHAHPSGDGTTVRMDIIFLALDGEQDIKKLMSLECTWIFFNELRFIEEAIFREATTRPGRFPRKVDGGPTWHGIFADTNPPDDKHWIYKLAEEVKPSNFKMFYQPSGLSPQAENLKNLPANYYENMMIGKTKEWINVYVHGNYGTVFEGQAVYENAWNDDFHATREPLEVIKGRTLVGGIDASGRSPAAVIAQQTPFGQLQVLWELCGEDTGAVMFSALLRQEVARAFPNTFITWWGDPAGAHKMSTDERTYFDILRTHGINVQPSPGYFQGERKEAVVSILSRNIGGKPALLVGPECATLRRGFNGAYRYPKTRFSIRTEARTPEKNEYSHVHDALQYLVCGLGELNTMKARNKSEYKTYSYETNW
jgi:hypothetical protein